MQRIEERARLLSVSTKESGAWLRALPVTALGLWMDDHTVRVAVGLRLGTAVCGPHSSQLCGTAVDSLGRHALSCRRSTGRHQRHTALNDIIKRGLSAAHVPSRLEPVGLLRSGWKRPDGVTLAPWKSGCLMVWDATCPVFCPFLQSTCHPRTREGRRSSGRQEVREVHGPPTRSLLLACSHRDLRGNWPEVAGPT